MHFQYVLYGVSNRFIYSINYTNDAGERTYALVTTSPKFAPEEVVAEALSITELKEFVFWDLFTQTVLRLPISERDISFTFHKLHLFPVEDIVELLDITDDNAIDNYNNEIISRHNKRRQAIIDIQTELGADFKMSFTEEEIMYYINLFNTHYFAEFDTDQTYLIKLCMLLKSTPYKLLRGPVVEQDLNTAKDQWMLVIKHYIERAKSQLDLEVGLLDEKSDSYKYDLEEIEIIKNLLDEIPEEFVDELDECETYNDLLEAWPPLLLPAPQFIIDQPSGMNAFEKLEKRIEWKFYD